MTTTNNVGFVPFLMMGLILFFLSFLAFDGCTGHSEGSYSIIVNKEYVPERNWTTFEYDSDTESFKTVNHHKSEEWNLCVDYKSTFIVMDVGKTYWHRAKIGEIVPVATWVGGITGTHYGYRIQPAENN